MKIIVIFEEKTPPSKGGVLGAQWVLNPQPFDPQSDVPPIDWAEEDLVALRATPGMVKAKEAQAEAWKDVMDTREEMITTAKTLGEYDSTGMYPLSDFNKALRMVLVDRTSGEVLIFQKIRLK